MRHPRVFQVLDYLAEGDGVASVVHGFADILAELTGERHIAVLRAHPALRAEITPLDAVDWRRDDTLVLHVYGPTRLDGFLSRFPGRRLLYFHNVTPPWFFAPTDALYHETWAGWRQVPLLARAASAWLAESAFNLQALATVSGIQRPARVVPPVVERGSAAIDFARQAELRAPGEVNLLFVGRLAPNKAQHRIMAAFEHFHRHVERRSRLHLVGAPACPSYVAELGALRTRLSSGEAIEMPGKVSDAALEAYYRTADLFLCLSEHEGFCLPPLVAAAHGIPVVAGTAAALPETVGSAAILIPGGDPARCAEVCGLLLEDRVLRERLRASATRQLRRFSRAAVREAWRATLDALQ